MRTLQIQWAFVIFSPQWMQVFHRNPFDDKSPHSFHDFFLRVQGHENSALFFKKTPFSKMVLQGHRFSTFFSAISGKKTQTYTDQFYDFDCVVLWCIFDMQSTTMKIKKEKRIIT